MKDNDISDIWKMYDRGLKYKKAAQARVFASGLAALVLSNSGGEHKLVTQAH